MPGCISRPSSTRRRSSASAIARCSPSIRSRPWSTAFARPSTTARCPGPSAWRRSWRSRRSRRGGGCSREVPMSFLTRSDAPVIAIDAVTVRYRVPRDPALTLKEYAIRRLARRVSFREIDALDDVSVTIGEGEALAVIGPNGAGKTTLLRLIARVLTPTSGRVRLRGRVAPILDLVGGFHPELTGRENIYLNGTLLGLTRRDIDSRLREIVAFAELDGFIDAPVRMYSSGMV